MKELKKTIKGKTYAISEELFYEHASKDCENLAPYYVVQEKLNSGEYMNVHTFYDKEIVFNNLARFLFDKYVNKATYIKRIVRIQHYTHIELQIYFVSGRAVFVLPAHF